MGVTPVSHYGRGTEGAGSGMPDSLSTTFIFTGNRLVTWFGSWDLHPAAENYQKGPLRWEDSHHFDLTVANLGCLVAAQERDIWHPCTPINPKEALL